jgi:hypothetical protein
MSNPRYATVLDYVTFGHRIVQAQYIPKVGFSLTGLVVELPDNYDWQPLDILEAGYNRELVTTTSGEKVFMYTAK